MNKYIYYITIFIIIFSLCLFFMKTFENFNVLDYQFSNENKPLKNLGNILNYDDPWVSSKNIYVPVKETLDRKISKYLDEPIITKVEVINPKPSPKLIDYQFSEFNLPSEPLNYMKISDYAPWSTSKKINNYIIPDTITPYGKNLYDNLY